MKGGMTSFDRFGVTERMIRETLSAALSRGGDHADLFFQHRTGSQVGLEDGAVNRAYASVELGVGVRVVRGDQTGYGYTEDLTGPALLECARTAAAIADGPARTARTPTPSEIPAWARLTSPSSSPMSEVTACWK